MQSISLRLKSKRLIGKVGNGILKMCMNADVKECPYIAHVNILTFNILAEFTVWVSPLYDFLLGLT